MVVVVQKQQHQDQQQHKCSGGEWLKRVTSACGLVVVQRKADKLKRRVRKGIPSNVRGYGPSHPPASTSCSFTDPLTLSFPSHHRLPFVQCEQSGMGCDGGPGVGDGQGPRPLPPALCRLHTLPVAARPGEVREERGLYGSCCSSRGVAGEPEEGVGSWWVRVRSLPTPVGSKTWRGEEDGS